jgi:hypothetical protein
VIGDIQNLIDRLAQPEIARKVTAIIEEATDDPRERMALLSSLAFEPLEAIVGRDGASEAIARKVDALELLGYAHGLIG